MIFFKDGKIANMDILFCGIILLLAAFLIHFFIWKFRLPKHHTKALLAIFALVYLCNIIVFLIFLAFHSYYDFIQFSLLFVSLTLVYISSYSAVEVDSPSLSMLLIIAEAGPEGLPKEKLYDIMTDAFLVKPRIIDLVNDKILFLDKDKYKVTRKGAVIAKMFILSRSLLKTPKGG